MQRTFIRLRLYELRLVLWLPYFYTGVTFQRATANQESECWETSTFLTLFLIVSVVKLIQTGDGLETFFALTNFGL